MPHRAFMVLCDQTSQKRNAGLRSERWLRKLLHKASFSCLALSPLFVRCSGPSAPHLQPFARLLFTAAMAVVQASWSSNGSSLSDVSAARASPGRCHKPPGSVALGALLL